MAPIVPKTRRCIDADVELMFDKSWGSTILSESDPGARSIRQS
jgi:hypothetical protein